MFTSLISELSTTSLAEILPLRSTPVEESDTRPALQDPLFSAVLVNKSSALEEHVPAWEDLAASALEPNPFYEHWMLLPALKAFGQGEDIRVILIFACDRARPSQPPLLCGLFPLERKARYRGFPIATLSLWKHLFCFLCTPLIRAEYGRECLAAFFDWLASDSNDCPLMEFNFIAGEGPLYRLLASRFNEQASLTFVSECFTRAMFRPAADAETYLKAAISRSHRKDLRRKQKRLSELGEFEYTALEPGQDPDPWLEEFLQIESSGWKKEDGGALASSDSSRNFFMAAAKEAHRRNRLMMIASRVDGRPVAMKCNFLAGPGSFAFKIGFDENFSHFSPGMLLEIENIRRLHAMNKIQWMDSCATPDHFMINRLWTDRRIIQTTLVSTGKRPGDLAVSLMPLLRWLNRKRLSLRGAHGKRNFNGG